MKPRATLLALAWPALFGAAAQAADLHVAVGPVRGAEGQVKLMLFDHAEGFRKEDQARAVLALPARSGRIEGVFRDLPPGRYAIVAYHDENNDGKLNLRFGMFPKEGYGLSNNPKVSGPPRFADSAFALPKEGSHIDIPLAY